MKNLEKEYPVLKEDRQQREVKTKNRRNLFDFIGKGIWLLLRFFF